jgi:tetratricopeptide (TPR) repeat protein
MLVLAPLLLTAVFPALPVATVGKINFPVSCSAPAQAQFTRGVSALHSFWYGEALTQFKAAEKSDPRCVMAFWGEAMAHLELLWINDDVPAARAALAKVPGEAPTARERAWLVALRPLVADGDPWPRRAAFVQAMETFHQQFPDDDEGKAFLALALLTATPDDNLSNRARAAALAFEIIARNHEHPGALHYAIHALDTPELAPLGLPAARRYATIAPEAFHARHMPAHIFTRLGMWQEALASCQSAWDASQHWIEKAKLATDERDYHSLQWIISIDHELGKRQAAEAALQRFLDGARHGSAGTRSWYSAVLLEHLRATREWSRLAELSPPAPDGDGAVTAGPACHGAARPERDRAERLRVETQRWAAAARHDATEVARLNGLLVDLRQRLAGEREKRMGHEIYVRFVDEEKLTDAALLAAAKRDAATEAARWRDLAALEDRDPPLEGADGQGGAHFLAGVTLLEAGRMADARVELERSLARYPAHTATFLALGRALDRLGDLVGARANYTRALAGWREADADFKPAAEARAWLAAHPSAAAR